MTTTSPTPSRRFEQVAELFAQATRLRYEYTWALDAADYYLGSLHACQLRADEARAEAQTLRAEHPDLFPGFDWLEGDRP